MEENVKKVIINFRKKVLKTPKYNRAKKLIKLIREYSKRIAKVEEVKISERVNRLVWNFGETPKFYKFPLEIRIKENIAYVDLDIEKLKEISNQSLNYFLEKKINVSKGR